MTEPKSAARLRAAVHALAASGTAPDPVPQGEYLFHVTFASALSDIADTGLRAGGGQGMGQQHGSHTRRGVFLTDADGVSFWVGRAEQWAEHRSDDLLEDELVPVVLRTPSDRDVERDEHGTRDANADAWISADVPADDLEIWDGKSWVSVEEYDRLKLRDAFDFEIEGEDEGEDGDDGNEGDDDWGDDLGDGDGDDAPRELASFKYPSAFQPPDESMDE